MQSNQTVDFYDIYEYYTIPFWQKTWFYVTMFFVVGLIIGLLVFYIWYRRRRFITPWDWALMELTRLSKKSLQTKDDIKRFYFELTKILKTYLAKRYRWTIDNKTDDELVAFLEEKKFNADLIAMLKKTAEGAQWIKFANETALKAQVDQDTQTVKILIEQTRTNDDQTI